MTIRHFQIFKSVCDSDGITLAAERLNITQPSVSIAIKELEAFYNTKLFDRLGRKIYLTEAGEVLRRYVECMLGQYEEAELVLRNGTAFSTCRLGVNVSFSEFYLAHLISEIKKELPDCVLQIIVQNNEHLDHLLSDNQIDFAIYDASSDRTTKSTEHLFKEEMLLLCAPSLYNENEITPETLSHYPLLLREEGSGARACVNKAFFSIGRTPAAAIESTSTLSLLSLAKEGLGFVFIPQALAENAIRDGLRQVALQSISLSRSYYLAHNEHKHLTNTMKELSALICRLLQEHSPS